MHRSDEVGSRAQLGRALALVVAKALFLMLSLAAVSAMLGERLWDEPGILAFLAVGSVLAVDVGGTVGLGLLLWGRASPSSLGWKEARLADLGLGLAGGIVTVAALLGLAGLWFGPEAPAELWGAIWGWSPAQRGLFAMIGLGAALGEESLFRGYLQPGLERRCGTALAILLTSVIFALYHLQPHPVALLGKVVVGVICGVLRAGTGRLWAPAVAHGLVWVSLGMA